MKITIETENDEEKKQFPDNIIIGNIFEFGITARYTKQKLFEAYYSHIHIADKYVLSGRLYELIARLKTYD